MDRFLIAGAVLLLFLEIGALLTNLDASGLNPHAVHSQKQIGIIAMKKNAVQTRGAHTLIWDEARSNESLYEYDSVLTLSGSSASLSLGDTRVELDQDTLVVLEPNSDVAGGFKIRFSKGSSRSRNPSQPIQIVTDAFEMIAAPGSNLLLSSLSDGRLDLDVEKGHVDMNGPGGLSKLESGEWLLLKNGVVEEKKKLTDEFRWESGIPPRIYAERFPVKMNVGWQGDAKRVKVLEPEKAIAAYDVARDRQARVALGEGKSFLWLEDGDRVSHKAEVEVLAVPAIRVFNPRMRDRVRTGETVVFAWSSNEQLKKYRVELSRQSDFRTIETSLDTDVPRVEHPFAKAGTYYWRITPFDEIGVQLPSTSPGEFSVVPIDLEAPQLNPPEIREPAEEKPKSGAMLWMRLFESRADARSLDAVAVFSWKPVKDAEYYQIEISTTPDFSVLAHSEKITATKFVWMAAREKKYYYRVAAGRGEELGPFSEVDTVLVKALPLKTKVVATPKSDTVPVQVPVQVPVPAADADADADADRKSVSVAVTPTPEPVKPALPEISFADRTHRRHGRVGLTPNYRISKTTNDQETVGSFSGFVPISLAAEGYFSLADQSRVEVSGLLEQVNWKPKDTSTPQGNLSEVDYGFSVGYRFLNSSWLVAAGADNVALLKRKASEEGVLDMSIVFGPSVRFTHELGKGVADLGIDVRAGSQLKGARLNAAWVIPVFSEKLSFGPQASDEMFTGEGESQNAMKLGIYFGYGW